MGVGSRSWDGRENRTAARSLTPINFLRIPMKVFNLDPSLAWSSPAAGSAGVAAGVGVDENHDAMLPALVSFGPPHSSRDLLKGAADGAGIVDDARAVAEQCSDGKPCAR